MKVAIVMGSYSDYEFGKKAEETLLSFGVSVETRILSAHRTPEEVSNLVTGGEDTGIEVYIAMAGMAAHLAGAIAANTSRPVIGVPLKSETLQGWDALLSTVQMPPGIPVATVAVNGAVNGALLAVQMLGLKYADLNEKMKAYREEMRKGVLEKDVQIREG
jgi:5-(carboxyamino)imidazole ribonucleotide mutase